MNDIQYTPLILIVEDDDHQRKALMHNLENEGYRIIEADCRLAAISLLESGTDPDLVITDIQMIGPNDGFALADWLAIHRPGLPVVLCSGGNHAAELARRSYSHLAFLAKPISQDLIKAQITPIIGSAFPPT